MLQKVLVVLLVAALALAAFVATRPGTFRIERSATLATPPETAFAHVNDFRQWAAWSPWEKLDPAMTRTFEGAESGVGAGYFWSGTDEVGEGRMTITESVPFERVVIRLEFLKPWKAVNTTTFAFAPDGAGTRVTWSMDGTHGFLSKAMGLFMDMDAMIGSDFEKGLAGLGAVTAAATSGFPDTTAAPAPAGP